MGVFSELKPQNNARKNPFDLSCYSSYNTKAGIILPLQSWPTLPSSEYELDLKALLRTQPLQTAAFAGFSFNYDVVWSPYNDHYSSFNQFIAQRLNKQHVTQPDIREIPYFELNVFVKQVLALALYESFASEVDNFDYYLQVRGIPCHEFLLRSMHFNDYGLALGCLRTLDLLGYGNYLPLLKSYISYFKQLLDSNLVSYGWLDDYSEQNTTARDIDKTLPYLFRFLSLVSDHHSSFGKDLQFKMAYICDANGNLQQRNFYYDVDGYLNKFSDLLANLEDNYFNFDIDLAYQVDSKMYSLWDVMLYNKAFWQFYRNEYYDERYRMVEGGDGVPTFTARDVDYVELFNLDDFQGLPIQTDAFNVHARRLFAMFALKPHQYKKDLFTGLLPSTQYGSVSVMSADDVFYKIIGNVGSGNLPNLSSTNRQLYVAQSNGSNSSFAGEQFFVNPDNVRSDKFKLDPAPIISILELRKADSLQRFKERMLRAGNRTKDIFKAHGWDEPLSEKAFDVQFLGTFDGRLDINVVASTADTDFKDLGQLAANGVGVISGSKIHFKCHDFGCLMVLAYITKDAVYDAYGIEKRHSLLEPFDFPYPELQNVSLAPIDCSQLQVFKDSNKILGYLPQNMVYKTAVDKIHGEFFAVNPFNNVDSVNVYPQGAVINPMGIFSDMVTPRLDILTPDELSFFYIQPDCADNIFVVNADVNQDTDQFFGNVHFDLKAVQPLDVIGLPI